MRKFIIDALSDDNGHLSIKRILGTLLCIPFVSALYFERVPSEKMELVGFLIIVLITGTVVEKFSKPSKAAKTSPDE